MSVIHVTPFSKDKNLGKAYNQAFEKIGYNDWLCIRDIDTMFLTPNTPNIIEQYTKLYPETGIFTCLTNRISLAAKDQLYQGRISENSDIKYHIGIAESLEKSSMNKRTKILAPISGMLMVISKKIWDIHKFDESGLCLGVDNEYSTRISRHGLSIYRMDAVYIWHTYRIINGIHSKSHLL